MSSYFAGVFSDGTKTFCCIQDEAGSLLGSGESKSANIAYSVNITWESILNAITNAFSKSDLSIEISDLSVCAGIKGTELPESLTKIVSIGEKNFKKFKVYSDGYISYKAAFETEPGILVIADEGVVAYTLHGENFRKVGGWGFPQADEGSTSWVGAQAINHAFKVCDGIEEESALSNAILSRFNNSGLELCEFAMHHSAPRDFAEFYDIVAMQYREKDPAAVAIVDKAVEIIAELIGKLDDYNKKKHPVYFDGRMKEVLNTGYTNKRRVRKLQIDYPEKAVTTIKLLRKLI